jgi:peptidoglycan/LPS O-acetylase OafA/YrhL
MIDLTAARSPSDTRSGIHPPGGPSRRLPSLDGFRAISIALVVCAHATGTNTFGIRYSHWRLAALGALGVNIFFVVSGYLITHLLLQESDSNGKISLKDFYVRRALRICPAFYAFLVVMAIAAQAGLIATTRSDFLSALTYTMNCRATASWYVGHLWSLSVEAQFYLVWPLVLVFLGRRHAIRALVVLLVALPLIRAAILQFLPTHENLLFVVFREGFDALAVGCLFACLGRWLDVRPRYLRFLQSPAVLVAPTCVIVTQLLGPDNLLLSVSIGQAVKNGAIALCLERCVRYPQGVVGHVLNSRVFVFLGVLSYSLYLWQQPFLNRMSSSLLTSLPQNVALSVLAASSSYYLIERPFLKLRKLFRWRSAIRSPVGRNRSTSHSELSWRNEDRISGIGVLRPACATEASGVGADEESTVPREIES